MLSFLARTPLRERPIWQKAVLRRLARILAWLSLAGCIVCGILYVTMRAWLFPWLGENREWVAAKLSDTVGTPVSIERLEANWAGLRPRLRLWGVSVRSKEHEALRLEQVEATLSWMSLPRWMPYFHALEIIGPEIKLGRDKNGVFTVAGIRMDPDAPKHGNPIAWLFDQSRIVVRDATLVWDDALRPDARSLRLSAVQFSFERGFLNHDLKFQAQPPDELAASFEVRGDVRRYDSATLDGIAGHLSIGLENADLGAWSAWVDYPVPCKGRGRVHLWLDSDGEGTVGLSANLDLEGVETVLDAELPPLQFDRLSGRVLARYTPKSVEFGANGLWLESKGVSLYAPIDFRLELRNGADGKRNGGALSASSVDLASFHQLAGSLPLNKDMRAFLEEFDPKGRLRAFLVEWEGSADALQDWKVDAEFEGISLVARGLIPGMSSMSGQVKGNSQEGAFLLSSQNGYVDLPRVFEQARIPVSSLDASGGWNHKSGQLVVMLNSTEVVNDDAVLRVRNSSYWPMEGGRPGVIDITGELVRGQGAAVWRYIPIVAGKQVNDWLKDALTHANVTGATVKLKGPLNHFPFRDGTGEFSVIVQAEDGRLDYAKGWPALDKINAELHFKGPSLSIKSPGGNIFGVQVEAVEVKIPDFREGVMTITGAANGPSADFLRFIAESPLSNHLHNFTDSLQAEGNGRLLNFKLEMPLHEVSETEVSGEYRFAANRIRLNGPVSKPVLEVTEGSLGFTRDSLKELSINGRLLGGECTIKGKTEANRLELSLHGQVEMTAAREVFGWPLLGWVSGSTPWSAELALGQDNSRIAVHSGLKGLRSRLPEPFAKEADEVWPLEVMATSQGADKPWLVTAKQGDRLDAKLERAASGAMRGGVGLYRSAPTPSGNEVQVAATFGMLDVDAWQWSLGVGEAQEEGGGSLNDEVVQPLMSVVLDAKQVRIFGYTFSALELRAANNVESWTAHVNSTEAQGVVSWKRGGDGILSARLNRLALSGDEGRAKGNGESEGDRESASSSSPPPRGLPGLDVRSEEFAVGGRELGQLEVRATNQEGVWQLDNFSINHPAAHFSGSGRWQPDAQHSTLNFTLKSTDVGRYASTLGFDHVVHGGQAKLTGSLDWKGPPTRIDYPTLSGQIEVKAEEGRFERIEPGVGRLLGILSLQALPRRVTLDFRDVFSEGFVFDRIEGKTTVSGGVMRSDKIEIVGPAARVLMRGQTDIATETQDLQVTVRPSMSETVAIGAAVVNPIAGAITYVAQKTFGSPVDRLFSYDYKVTGSWVDPVVEKVGSSSEPVPKGGGNQNPLPSQ